MESIIWKTQVYNLGKKIKVFPDDKFSLSY